MIKAVAFDLDKTLTESKAPLDSEMAGLLCQLLKKFMVAVISGASFERFQEQFLPYLSPNCNLAKLYLLPTSGARLYHYRENWQEVYAQNLTGEEKNKIHQAFQKAFEETGFTPPTKIFGQLIEDRGTQITFSGLGSEAPLPLKEIWDPDLNKRQVLKKVLEERLPGFTVTIGGSTSIDVTRRGIDKSYGIAQLLKQLGLQPSQLIFVGDRLIPGGNDEPVVKLGVRYFSVAAPGLDDTRQLIRNWLEKGLE